MAAMSLLSSSACAKRAAKERLPTISEDECQDFEHEANQIRQRLCESFGELLRGGTDPEMGRDFIKFLKAADPFGRKEALSFLAPALPSLAHAQQGVIRAAIEVATSSDRPILLSAFRGSVLDLCQSKSGHEMLVQLIDSVPVFSLGFMVCEMIQNCKLLSMHRYASNVMESMLLHFHPSQLVEISSKVVEAAPSLARDPHGSRVLQTLIEYGNPTCRELLFRKLLPEIAMLTMHRTGSQVLRKALEISDANLEQLIAEAVLEGVRNKSVQVANIACSRCGSSILQQISTCRSPVVDEIHSRLAEALPQLEKSRYGRRLVRA
ncbi:APUM5 [Symbiodinium sp. CCMP2456]|nr:APUM5 [Symbiodinium sp. CCMP2456]